MEGKLIVVRKLYAYNLRADFSIIEQNLATYHFIAVDTEFPGTIFRSQEPYHQLSPEENYQLMKENVNSLKLTQLGLTLSDSSGKLPNLVTDRLGFSLRSFTGCKREYDPRKLTWVFFHSTYDVGYLIKVLTQQDLSKNHVRFMALVMIYLGTSVFYVKEIVKPLGWQVDLEKVAAYLGVNRVQ
ncbi:probable CCR4-associated factor 1 homolog 9 [Coffea eugenioides]|uniref:probable CCR4-associated factor 1 homolog 9 n=1 Tax=Coffea eugenioides TaxID=49369 RepID=UPI000F604FEF|nr:probable CCR4-associated factor 1 homolog 9 [Coffea eugenioides]